AGGWVGQRLKAVFQKRGEVWEVDTRTPGGKRQLKRADLVISCAGSPGLITAAMLKDGVAVLDLGTMVIKERKEALRGDVVVDEELKQKASFIAPVPGGIGPVTVACLFENLLEGKSATGENIMI
ncbi:hypothetical protein J7J95_01490, partial [bacterium]|nr:hypothetical protein [bacterium]